MGFEVEYIKVGNGSKCGDAIIVRYGELFSDDRSKWKIAVIDGGTLASGEKIVEYIKKHYKTDFVDYVFSTHLDMDHLSGLRIVLAKLNIGTFYIHLPWEHAAETSDLYKKDYSDVQLERSLQKLLDQVYEVEKIAFERGIPIEEPFSGLLIDNCISVLGPTKEYYEQLTSQFRNTPDEKKSAFEQALEMIRKAEEQVETWIEDRFDIDILGDDEKTSAENNSSLILMFFLGDHKLLFTGDAGIPALTAAFDFADQTKVSLKDIHMVHIPHHGSRHNMGSSLLKRIEAEFALVSASTDCDDHPSKRITNAFKKKNIKVYATTSNSLLHKRNAPERDGYSPAKEVPFYDKFKE